MKNKKCYNEPLELNIELPTKDYESSNSDAEIHLTINHQSKRVPKQSRS
jgi:hypothetical protein